MKKLKTILLTIFTMSLIWLFWFWVALALPFTKVDSSFSLSENIFVDSLNLSENKIIIKSGQKAENFKISWECWIFWENIASDWYTHIFNVRLLEKDCPQEKIKITLTSTFSTIEKDFNLIKPFDLYNKFLDYSDKDLQDILQKTKKYIEETDYNQISDSEKKVKTYRNLEEAKYFIKIFEEILKNRKNKYAIPVVWVSLPKRETKLPNSFRPYRQWYTQWIHQGWDFDAKKLTKVVSLDDAIVIRVVDSFKTSDFAKLKRNKNLTYNDKLLNLDILRWNQVWIKTSKWEVAFYSHLDSINKNIKVWKILKKWEEIGKVWATWVPEEGYSDFHLHIEIYKNPYNLEKAWKYSYLEIMSWPWLFKGQKFNYILENQTKIFD